MPKAKTQSEKELKPGDVVCQKICKDAVITEFTNLKDWTGQYCAICMKVVPGSYKKIVPVKEKENIASSANYEQPKKKAKIQEPVKETVQQEKPTIKEIADASEGRIKILTMPKPEPAPIPTILEFPIADVFPAEENDTIRLMFATENGEPFYVPLKSTPEKTAQLLGAKQALIGRKAKLEFLSINDVGIPTNAVFKGLVQ